MFNGMLSHLVGKQGLMHEMRLRRLDKIDKDRSAHSKPGKYLWECDGHQVYANTKSEARSQLKQYTQNLSKIVRLN